MIRRLSLFIFTLLLLACDNTASDGLSAEPMPLKPDYTQEDCWYTDSWQSANKNFDVFYILPTCVFDWSDSDGITYHYADVYSDAHREAQLYSYELAEKIFGESANFYAPYYRQITLDVWIDGEEAVERLFPAAMADVTEAFEYYIQNHNGGRPFVIAGFSQGGKGVVELVKMLSSSVYSQMIAAYVIGYKVTADDLENANITAATRADDTGVTICYSSVSDVAAINKVISDSEICINPVNWCVDNTLAELNNDDYNITVSVNTEHNILIIDGLEDDDGYISELDALFKRGNYHLLELELYKEYLSTNVALRASKFEK